MDSSALIDKLGGTTAVARELRVHISTVGNWRTRGISWRYRPRVAKIAEAAGIRVPANFLLPPDDEAA